MLRLVAYLQHIPQAEHKANQTRHHEHLIAFASNHGVASLSDSDASFDPDQCHEANRLCESHHTDRSPDGDHPWYPLCQWIL